MTTRGGPAQKPGTAMNVYEIRDLDEVRTFLYQGLWLQRTVPPTAETVKPALEWCLEVLARGHPLPPVGFVADLGHVAFDMDWEGKAARHKAVVPNVPSQLLPTYEDHVLGKIYADWSFSSATESLRRYKEGRHRARGLAFVLEQFRQRAGFDGVEFAPSVIHSVLDSPPDEILRLGYESLQNEGLRPYIRSLYESLITATRLLTEVLAPEDLIELQQGTALDEEGERLAFRHVVQAGLALEASLPRHRVRPLARRQEVPTRVLDEDTYPVGGFSSISNRGSVESLLHSQLAYMDDDEDRPDLFDIKFLRDELLYYSRDENQFLRRRRSFVLAFFPDLIQRIRFKDTELPWQRGILLLAVLFVAIRKLIEWLNTDALLFELVFIIPPGQPRSFALEAEYELLTRLFREQVANNTVVFDFFFLVPPGASPEAQKLELEEIQSRLREKVPHGTVRFDTATSALDALRDLCIRRARRSLCHCLTVSMSEQNLQAEDTVVTQMEIDGPCPALAYSGEVPIIPEADDALETWGAALQQLLQRWI
jgi:vWA domain found in the FtsH ternary systems/N-terminal helical region fused to the FtsH ternary system vWA domain